uniref:Out at first protein homolog n=1 Tax=Sinocyclocheilus grahami TaxID=75366 RepID=A0A672QXX4_SINGR
MNARVALVQIAFVVFTLLLSVNVCSQLTVLVRLNDGQITEELLEADSEKDITVEFRQTDGTLHVKIFHALVLGEPEKGQSQYQALCFISHLDHGELIPSETMARLRQKNPHVVRSADKIRSVEQFTMNAALNMSRSWHLSTHIHNVYVKYCLNVTDLQSRSSTTDPWQPCACSYRLNLEWFPCQLKYCQGSNPYKCGIKSCSKSAVKYTQESVGTTL